MENIAFFRWVLSSTNQAKANSKREIEKNHLLWLEQRVYVGKNRGTVVNFGGQIMEAMNTTLRFCYVLFKFNQ